MGVLHWLSQNHELITKGAAQAIIPTVFIPLTALTVALTSFAAMVAGWFGIKLNTEGPKQFLEVLLKKRVLITMLILNLAIVGIYKAYIFVHTLPSFIYTIESHSKKNAVQSQDNYSDSLFRPHDFKAESIITNHKKGFVTLELIKEMKIPKGAFRSGVVSGPSIFFGSDDGHIYEIDKNDLKIIRKFFIGTEVTTRPVIYQGKIYAGEGVHDTHHARIYSFDLKTGKFLKAFKTKGHTEGQPIIADQSPSLMFVTAGKDGLYAVDTNTMKQVWHNNEGHLDATVTLSDNIVYAGTGMEKGTLKDRNSATAYDYFSGKLIWKKELPLSNWMHPLITTTDTCYVLGEIYFKSQIGMLHCLNKKDGTPHFSIPFDEPFSSNPVYLKTSENQYIFVAGLHGNVCGVDIGQKEKKWCTKTSKLNDEEVKSFSSVEYDDKNAVLWYASMTNGIFALDLNNGNIISQWLPKDKETPLGVNYASVTIDGSHLYQIDIEGTMRLFNIIVQK